MISPFPGWYYLDINPEQWAVGPLQIGRRKGDVFATMGRNQELYNFKEAVRAELEGEMMLDAGLYQLDVWYWRKLDTYQGEKKQVQKNFVDGTNMFKALEDALQGTLIDNDRNVRRGQFFVVDQGADVVPGIAFHLQRFYVSDGLFQLPPYMRTIREASVQRDGATPESSNVWPPVQ